jgi:hypothetical protein
MSIGTSTGLRLIAPATVAATGPDTAAIALAEAAIAAAGTAAATEVAAGIGAAAAVATADRQVKIDRSGRPS